MKLQTVMSWALVGCFAASTAVNFQLLGLLSDSRIEIAPSSAEPFAIQLQPILGSEKITELGTLTLSKEQCEQIRACSMT